MLHVDKKFLSLLSGSLNRFSWTSQDTAMCRCPICGDSKKNKYKRRGYWYPEKGSIVFKCHNCGEFMGIGQFLKMFDNTLYREYTYEKYRESSLFNGYLTSIPKQKQEEKQISLEQVKQSSSSFLIELKKLSSLPPNHPALEYWRGRNLPEDKIKELYYTPKFYSWASQWNEKFSGYDESHDHPRTIIPLIDSHGEVYGYSARCFGKEIPKYIMGKFNIEDDRPTRYGMNLIDTSKPVYVVEGPIDSMFLDNCIAICNASLHSEKVGDILIYDNQPRNREVVRAVEAGIKSGKRVCIWPDTFPYKDINEAVQAGFGDIQGYIDKHTYSGLTLELKFSQWKKV